MRSRRRRRKRKPALLRLRRLWGRNPAQRPHSTKKGAKGYDRRRDKRPPDLEEYE